MICERVFVTRRCHNFLFFLLLIFTVASSERYFNTILLVLDERMREKIRLSLKREEGDKSHTHIYIKIWSKRKTPKVCTKFWSSCVRHVQIEIMLPFPTRLALTSVSVSRSRIKSDLIICAKMYNKLFNKMTAMSSSSYWERKRVRDHSQEDMKKGGKIKS